MQYISKNNKYTNNLCIYKRKYKDKLLSKL